MNDAASSSSSATVAVAITSTSTLLAFHSSSQAFPHAIDGHRWPHRHTGESLAAGKEAKMAAREMMAMVTTTEEEEKTAGQDKEAMGE